jgi:hypothetical protein
MADVTVKILEPASDFRLMSLSEAKIALGMSSSDTSSDQQLNWLIETQSAVISTMTNRVFAREKVQETWRDTAADRMFLTHWPVKEEDILSVTTGGYDRTDWELEEASGKLSFYTNSIYVGMMQPAVVTYFGGFMLPDDAPLALKQSCSLLVGNSKTETAAAALTGVRMISHKESRVMFHSNTASSGGGGEGTSAQTRETVRAMLSHYIRHWV